MAEAFGMDIGIPVVNALADLTGLQQSMSDIPSQSGRFQATLVFGDWLTIGRMFINLMTGSYAVGMVQMLAQAGINFPPIFVMGIGALSASAFVWGLMYIISGRGTKQSD